MAVIDGLAIAKKLRQEIREKTQLLETRPPCLTVILQGDVPESKIYVRNKVKACEEAGIKSQVILLKQDASEEEILEQIRLLNADDCVDGILVQLPLPDHINPQNITEAIDPSKDVDGLHPFNVGKLLLGHEDGFFPCTPLGIIHLLKEHEIDTSGKHVVIIGRSNIVGKPVGAMLFQKNALANATVTFTHSRTKNLSKICSQADILIAAIGIPQFIGPDMLKEGAVVIDVGINRITDPSRKTGYRLVGDVDFEKVADRCSWITPVPRGVGPMTIAMLLQNTLKSYAKRLKVRI
jgi:methylenetetrahydrofolate dehydrogenase (NADP+)/methenyltetrahydrofolate cyclohydrolase